MSRRRSAERFSTTLLLELPKFLPMVSFRRRSCAVPRQSSAIRRTGKSSLRTPWRYGRLTAQTGRVRVLRSGGGTRQMSHFSSRSRYDLGANSHIQTPVEFEQLRESVKSVELYWMIVNQHPIANPMANAAGSAKWWQP